MTTILENRDILITVDPEASGQRLDRYLTKRLPHRSRASLRGLVIDGTISLHSVLPGQNAPEKMKPSTPVQGGMVLLIRQSARPPVPTEAQVPRSPMGVLWEDEHILAVNKPAGMLVHPSGTLYHETLIITLQAQLDASGDDTPLHLGHRLDRDTSGVLIVARGDEPNRVIKAAFKSRAVRKGYLAIVIGEPPWDEAHSDASLGDGPPGQLVRIRQVISPKGSSAHTQFRVIARAPGHALLACHPHTGRLHQIRLHLEGLGFPILGDKLYGTDGTKFIRFLEEGPSPELEAELGLWRHALHAHWIELPHPIKGHRLRLSSPLPTDLRRKWAELSGDMPPADWPPPSW